MNNIHSHFIQAAIRQALVARSKDEVPIGAVAVLDGEVIARAHNLKETRQDPTAHAELICLQKAARKLGNWRLNEVSIYVTLEPCPMCASALIQARVKQIIYGASDPIMGALGSKLNISQDHEANPIPVITGGVMADECQALIKDFFRQKRS